MPHEIRIRLGSFARKRYDITCSDAEAPKREEKMREVARDMVDAGLATEAHPILERMGTADAKDYETAVKLAEGLCAGRLTKKKPTVDATMTIRVVASQWTSGALHRRYPDQIKLKRTAEDDVIRFEKYINPVIGDRPVGAVTLDDCEAVMRCSPRR
jgi:hypothetical protein